ncbi:heat stress transcription factor B-3-like [Gossypium australe]|uniref:Heat stress transcription factor B-3-like n=1 Tax=Gossypium australe TaxID=47621 RepID=A0A5B6UKZ3_9ROSI|nr:heat stress transcription factor B-3-like [Gossypium australe]
MKSMMGSDNNKGLLEYVRKSTPPPFLLKTYMLVQDPITNDVISWNADGSGFVVWRPAEFARDLLPTLFKHSNFSSFVRQLNTYGFRKVATSRWEFCNEMFRKGEEELLSQIRRRKSWANRQQNSAKAQASSPLECEEDQRSSSTCSSSGFNNLMDENKRLRKENGALNWELTSMKRKFKELLDLVANYAQFEKEKDDDESPMLFGVKLEIEGDSERKRKRKRDEISESASVLLSQACK